MGGKDGCMDLGFGSGDEKVGDKNRRFKAENGRSYRATFCWYSVQGEDKKWNDEAAFDKEGNLTSAAKVRFTGCERIYIKGVGNVLYNGPAYAQFGQPKQQVATIIIVWPTDKDGDLDGASFKAGKGWQVMPFIFSPDKYQTISKSNKRFPLLETDLLMACPEGGAEYQKLTFTPENKNLLRELMKKSESPELKALVSKILADVKAVAQNIHRELAQNLTIEQIKEKLGKNDSPVGETANHTSPDIDTLLDDVL